MSMRDDNIPLADDDPQGIDFAVLLLLNESSVIHYVPFLIFQTLSMSRMKIILIEPDQRTHCPACTMMAPVRVPIA